MIFPGRFDGKTLVVTGAAQGLGEAVATRAAREGGTVALVDRSEIVHEVSEKLNGDDGKTVSLTADLEQYGDCSTVMAQANERLGRIDILINNVGGAINFKPYVEFTEEQIVAEIRRSLFPTLWCCRAVLPFMVERRQGTIVNVSSTGARLAGIGPIDYNVSKAALAALTKIIAEQFGAQGVRAITVSPGPVATGVWMDPDGPIARLAKANGVEHHAFADQMLSTMGASTGRLSTPEEVARLIAFTASPNNITGADYLIDGGIVKTV